MAGRRIIAIMIANSIILTVFDIACVLADMRVLFLRFDLSFQPVVIANAVLVSIG